MKNFKFACPQCGSQVEATEAYRGLAVACPHCGKGIVVPGAKSSSSLGNKTKSPRIPAETNGAQTPTDDHVKSTKLHIIRPERTVEPAPAPLPARYQLPLVESDEPRGDQNDTDLLKNVVLLFCIMGILVVGGGLFVVLRFDKKYAALKNMIEQTGRPSGEVMPPSFDCARDLYVLSNEVQSVSRRITAFEAERRQNGGHLMERNRTLEEKCSDLLNRFESISRRISENARSIGQLENSFSQLESSISQLEDSARQTKWQKPDRELFAEPQVGVRDSSDTPSDSPKESFDELQQKMKNNLAEIKDLQKKNPAVYINPRDTSIINIEKKIATMKDRRYCACVNVTFVRDMFYCTGCKRVSGIHDHPCCNVSRKQSYYRWKTAREKVDETAAINERLDALYAENEALEKQIRATKRSRPR